MKYNLTASIDGARHTYTAHSEAAAQALADMLHATETDDGVTVTRHDGSPAPEITGPHSHR